MRMIGGFRCRIAGGLRGLGAADRRCPRGRRRDRWREHGHGRLGLRAGIAAAAGASGLALSTRFAFPARLALRLGSIAGVFP